MSDIKRFAHRLADIFAARAKIHYWAGRSNDPDYTNDAHDVAKSVLHDEYTLIAAEIRALATEEDIE